jgi:outer membrane protein assembly factor BamB
VTLADDTQRRLAWVIAVTAAFAVIVGAAMLVNHFQVATHDPLTSHALAQKKDLLRDDPPNEKLKQEIRELDLEIRQRFFRHLALNQTGAWLLLGGLAAFLVVSRTLVGRRANPPSPQRRADDAVAFLSENQAGRRAVAVTTLALAGLLLLLALVGKTLVPDSPEALAKLLGGDTSSATPGPTPEDIRGNWPQFRGPTGDGVATTTNLPMDWNGTTGEGISWKSPVPLPGFSSPVVWQDRVFVSGGNESARAVFCFSASDGNFTWQGLVPPMPAPPGDKLEIQEFTGVAAPTPATDGRRLFAIFATGELVAFHFDGKLAWSKHLGVPENPYGFASSLVVHDQKLIVQYDQGQAEDEKSRLYAFDTATGRVVWEQRRALPSSWTTPLLIHGAGKPQLIVLSQPWSIAYDPASGRELWRADCLGADLAPSPVFGRDLLYIVHPSVSILALRVDGSGDVTKTHIAWQNEDGAPDITSPVTDGTHIFALTTWGTLTCLDAQTGVKLAEKDLEMEFNASPILLGGRLLLVAIPGVASVISANPALDILARAELGETVHASPALVDGRLYLRGKDHLYAIGSPTGSTANLTYGQ